VLQLRVIAEYMLTVTDPDIIEYNSKSRRLKQNASLQLALVHHQKDIARG